MTETPIHNQQQSLQTGLALCRTLLQENTRLWPLVSQYLFDFTSLADKDRLRAALAPLNPALLAPGSPCRDRLASFALQKLGILPFFHHFPKEDGSRILLLKTNMLLLLAEWLGALAFEPALRRTISGTAVQAARQAMPHAFPVVFRRSYRYRKWTEKLQNSVQDRQSGTQAPESISRHGIQLLFSLLAHLPKPLLQRMTARYPARFEAFFTPLASWKNEDSDLTLLFTLLEQECPEGWEICCY